MQYHGPSATNPVRPTRVGRSVHQDNSALTVWNEAGNEVFSDADFMVESGRDRHFMDLLANADDSYFIGRSRIPVLSIR